MARTKLYSMHRFLAGGIHGIHSQRIYGYLDFAAKSFHEHCWVEANRTYCQEIRESGLVGLPQPWWIRRQGDIVGTLIRRARP